MLATGMTRDRRRGSCRGPRVRAESTAAGALAPQSRVPDYEWIEMRQTTQEPRSTARLAQRHRSTPWQSPRVERSNDDNLSRRTHTPTDPMTARGALLRCYDD